MEKINKNSNEQSKNSKPNKNEDKSEKEETSIEKENDEEETEDQNNEESSENSDENEENGKKLKPTVLAKGNTKLVVKPSAPKSSKKRQTNLLRNDVSDTDMKLSLDSDSGEPKLKILRKRKANEPPEPIDDLSSNNNKKKKTVALVILRRSARIAEEKRRKAYLQTQDKRTNKTN